MPSAHTAKVPQALLPGRTPIAFARHDGRKMALTDEQLAALTPCEVSPEDWHGLAAGSCAQPTAAFVVMSPIAQRQA